MHSLKQLGEALVWPNTVYCNSILSLHQQSKFIENRLVSRDELDLHRTLIQDSMDCNDSWFSWTINGVWYRWFVHCCVRSNTSWKTTWPGENILIYRTDYYTHITVISYSCPPHDTLSRLGTFKLLCLMHR